MRVDSLLGAWPKVLALGRELWVCIAHNDAAPRTYRRLSAPWWVRRLRWLWANYGAPQARPSEVGRLDLLARSQVRQVCYLDAELPAVLRALDKGNVPLLVGRRQDPAARAWRQLVPTLVSTHRRVILLPDGSQERMAWITPILRMAAEREGPHTVLLVATEDGCAPMASRGLGWDSGDMIALGDLEGPLDGDARVELLVFLLRALKPASVLLAGSRAGGRLLQEHAHPLAAFTRLHVLATSADCARGPAIASAMTAVQEACSCIETVIVDTPGTLEHLALRRTQASESQPVIRVISAASASSLPARGADLRAALCASPSFLD